MHALRRLALLALPLAACFRAGPATVVLRVVDAGTGAPLAAWATLEEADGTPIPPPEAPRLFILSWPAFIVPAGGIRLAVARPVTARLRCGFEYRTASILLAPGEGDEAVVRLTRLTDPVEKGWHAATVHMHMQSDKARPILSEAALRDMMAVWPAADGYRVVVNAAMGVGDLPQVMGWAADRFPAGNLVEGPALWDMGEEYRANPEGHVLFWNLERYVEPGSAGDESYQPGKPNWPSALEACGEARRQGGYVAWAHAGGGTAFEAAVALGLCEGICLGDMGFGYDRWYRLLNAGYRVTAVAGSDFIFNHGTRCYAQVDGPLTRESWVEALRRGRTFATSGPLVFATVDGHPPGDTLLREAPGPVTVEVEAVSKEAFGAVEIVVNGGVAARRETMSDRRHLEARIPVDIPASAWVAVRTCGMDGEDGGWTGAIDSPIEPRHMRRAHTTPVYVEIGGKPVGDPEACRAVRCWIEHMSLPWAREKAVYPSEDVRMRAIGTLEEAVRRLGERERALRPSGTPDGAPAPATPPPDSRPSGPASPGP